MPNLVALGQTVWAYIQNYGDNGAAPSWDEASMVMADGGITVRLQ